jgi:hypothetical protein
MLILDRRTLLRSGSDAVGAAALAPTAPAPAHAREAVRGGVALAGCSSHTRWPQQSRLASGRIPLIQSQSPEASFRVQ